MEDSFNVRVDKVFGPLSSSPNPIPVWSLTDQEIEKREWNREKGILKPEPEPEGFFRREDEKVEKSRNEMEKDVNDLDDEGFRSLKSRASLSRRCKPDEFNDVELDIKASIGMDPTLDSEEEEDEYDRVAFCKEDAGEALYTRDVCDLDTELDYCNDRVLNMKLQRLMEYQRDCKNNNNQNSEGAKDNLMKTCVAEEAKDTKKATILQQDHPLQTPDYMRDPLKYTHYILDSSDDVDEKLNQLAFMDFVKLVKSSSVVDSQTGPSEGLPQSVSFIPKKKSSDVTMRDIHMDQKQNQYENQSLATKESLQRTGHLAGIAAYTRDGEVCAMDEDVLESQERRKSSDKPGTGRQYRKKVQLESEEL